MFIPQNTLNGPGCSWLNTQLEKLNEDMGEAPPPAYESLTTVLSVSLHPSH